MICGLRSVRLEVIWAWYHSARRVTSQSAYVHVPLYWQIPDIDSPAAVGQYIMAPSHTSRRSDCSRAFLIEGARVGLQDGSAVPNDYIQVFHIGRYSRRLSPRHHILALLGNL